MKLPVLLLLYNRSEEAKKILKYLFKLKIRNIYISIDGPKNNEHDKKSFNEILNFLNLPKYKKIKLNFLKKNYGCKRAVEKGISWFFSKEKKGIILEDDCVPNKSFFIFCEKMLNKYEGTEIKVISGNNFLKKNIKIQDHYYFSKFNHCWGWATWRKEWKLYDGKLKNWKKFKNSKIWKNFFKNNTDKKYWEKIFDLSYKNYFDSWAYPWLFSIWYNKGCTIIPKYNLVKNIGFKGTHNSFYSKNDFSTYELTQKYRYPKKISINENADDFIMKNFFVPKNFLWPSRFLYLFKRFLLNPLLFIMTLTKKIKKKNAIY